MWTDFKGQATIELVLLVRQPLQGSPCSTSCAAPRCMCTLKLECTAVHSLCLDSDLHNLDIGAAALSTSHAVGFSLQTCTWLLTSIEPLSAHCCTANQVHYLSKHSMHLPSSPILLSPEHLLPHGFMSNSSLLLFNEAPCTFASYMPCICSPLEACNSCTQQNCVSMLHSLSFAETAAYLTSWGHSEASQTPVCTT